MTTAASPTGDGKLLRQVAVVEKQNATRDSIQIFWMIQVEGSIVSAAKQMLGPRGHSGDDVTSIFVA
ncbi:hypothetical protein [Paraburkholderia sp. BCC1886]|uniref:hypothetical protein n=1 Tax=Paraburkholderia sp. BCC1886 TaxID=2562670 RepID=UPI001181CBF9|nr:hypothetical protein [Paraburkholderia sp. BCC1886]